MLLADEDHTADVRVRSFGADLKECLEGLGVGMVNYMTDIDLVEPREPREIEVIVDDAKDMIFHFLDEILFLYGSEYFMTSSIEFSAMQRSVEATDAPELSRFMQRNNVSSELFIRRVLLALTLFAAASSTTLVIHCRSHV